ncbi:MAG: hypothetical protein II882_08100 [Lachnospiraceae bacterium]|nr:hypothetical protein [Lachnospiraceae bacterium]
MSNKPKKVLGAVLSVLGSLFLVFLVAFTSRGGRLSDIINFSSLFSKETTAATTEGVIEITDTSITPQKPNASGDETVPVPTGNDPYGADRPLRVGVSALSGQFNPFTDLNEGDDTIMQLVGLRLLTRDRTGNVINRATEGEYAYYNNQRYLYTGPADISVEYDEAEDITTYTMKLKNGITFSDGERLTVDDLIFNLYVRLQPNFSGNGTLRSYNIVGLTNYYYNNSAAESIAVEEAEIDAELANHSEELDAYIRTLIKDTLEAEAEHCQSIWVRYIALGYGNSVQEFFYNLYGFDLNYNLVGKSLEEICADVIESYGTDYHLLGEKYAIDRDYFDDTVRTYARELIRYRKMTASGEGEPVDYISGIVRLGDSTLKLKLYGYNNDAIYQLFDMIIAPLHYYGNPAEYDYEAHKFGFERGNYTISETALTHPLGAGPYCFEGYDSETGTVALRSNPEYYKGKSGIEKIRIIRYGENALEQIGNGELDIVSLEGNKELYRSICGLNENDTTDGNVVYAESILDLGYSYIGISASNVRVGDDSYSEESRALREGLAVILAAFRDIAYGDYFGGSAVIIDYPVSPFFDIAPLAGEEDYQAAFLNDLSGKPIYRSDSTDVERYYAVIDAAREYFIKAGYVYDEASGKFTAAPEGASLRYEVMLCGDDYTWHPSDSIINYAKTVLYALGITLDTRYVSSEESMLVSLYLGEADIWCASWNCIGDPDFGTHYRNGTGLVEYPNLYNITDEDLNALLDEYEEQTEPGPQREIARAIMEKIRSWAVEVPCYVLTDYTVYNASTIDRASLAEGHSLYWTWINDVTTMKLLPAD